MDFLQGLPVWIQLVIVVLIAAVLIFMNIGWLIQARAWLQRQGQRPPRGARTTSTPPATQAPRDRV